MSSSVDFDPPFFKPSFKIFHTMKNVIFNILLVIMAIPALGQETAAQLEKAAHESYQRGYTEEKKEDKVKAFEEAAELFDKAADAYRKEGDAEKATSMEGWAKAARSNAEHYGTFNNGFQNQYSAVWSRIAITGPASKMPANDRRPRFNTSFTGAFPLGGVADQDIPLDNLRNAAFAPGAAEQLFEQLGGQVFIGNPSSQPTQTVGLSGRAQAMPGLRLGLRLGNRFELSASGQYFSSKWSGKFPVAVFPYSTHEQQQQPKTLQGSASASASGMLLDVGATFFVTSGAVKPYLKGGARGQLPIQNKSAAEIAGVLLPLEISPVATEFSPFGGAGLRVGFLKNGFVDAGCSFGKLPRGGYKPSLGVGIGWGF